MQSAIAVDQADLEIGMGRNRGSYSLGYCGRRHLDEVAVARILPQHLG